MLDLQIKANNIPTAINEEQLISFGWITKSEIQMLKKNAYRVNDFLSGYFAGIGLRLVQIRLKFGRIFNGDEFVIMLAGEISPETCVLQDLETNEKFDIYSLNQDCDDTVKNALSIYNEIARRLER
jgi:phosphoribosylaminoimidazole-succinocarboxamide synthase